MSHKDFWADSYLIESTHGYLKLHKNGQIERPNGRFGPSDAWRIVSAVERNNFGNAVRRWTLEQILADPGAIPWKHKNGKPRVFLRDIDHGTLREWGGPATVRKIGKP